MCEVATERAATNKLFRAAVFELRDAGRCDVNVRIDGPNDHAEIHFDMIVGNPWSDRTGVWPWILWPLPAIGLYGIHRQLVHRKRPISSGQPGDTGPNPDPAEEYSPCGLRLDGGD
jgi:hypothetical protein